ncbi:MAG: outer membrane beta-barrel protein [Bacteroidales bacterium]|nr:outer membrane beta-barrel protein [Bacteroidales bacterium]
MKKITIILVVANIILQAFGQEVISKENEETEKQNLNDEKTVLTLGNNLLIIEDDKDSLRIRIGNRGLEILESLEGSSKIHFEKYNINEPEENYNSTCSTSMAKKPPKKFKGHISGIELGFNGFLSEDNSFSLPSDIDYMNLHTGKSICFNIIPLQESFGFTQHFGLVTGMGLNWNNYRFDENNNIVKSPDGTISEFIPDEILKKSKLTTLYLTIPILLEVQVPTDNKQLNFGGGVIGAVKLGSHSKMVYKNGDKVKSNDDFSLNILRFGFTARAGFENLNFYATYYKTPLFISGKGPGGYGLYPFEIGVSITFND